MAPSTPAEAAEVARDVVALCKVVVEEPARERLVPAAAKLQWVGRLAERTEACLRDGRSEEALVCAMEALAAAAAHLETPQLRPWRERGLEAAQQVVELCRDSGSAAGEGQATLALARLQLSRGRPDAAVKLVAGAAALFQKAGDKRGEASCATVVVDAHLVKAALAGSGRTARRSHHLKMTPSEVEEELKAVRSKHLRDALAEARDAQELLTLAKDKRGKASLLCTLADIRLALGDLEDAKEAAMMARDLYHDVEDPRGEQAALLLELDAHIADKDGFEALDVGKEIVKVFRKAKDKWGEAEGLLIVMRVQFLMGQHDELMATAAEARALCKTTGDVKMEGLVIDAVMKLHIAKEKTDEAIKSAREAMELYRKARDKQGEAMALHSCACLELDRWFKEVEENLEHFKKMGCMPQYWKGVNKASYDEAVGMVRQAVELFQEAGDTSGKAMAEETLQSTERRAVMLNEPDETKQIFKDGRVVDVVRTWRPSPQETAEGAGAPAKPPRG